MFRDRQEALEELEKQLLSEEEEEEVEEEAEFDEEYEEEDEAEPPRKPFDFDAYNTDASDTDLEEYSEEVYDTRKKTGCSLWLLLLAAFLLAFAYYVAKQEGLL